MPIRLSAYDICAVVAIGDSNRIRKSHELVAVEETEATAAYVLFGLPSWPTKAGFDIASFRGSLLFDCLMVAQDFFILEKTPLRHPTELRETQVS